MIYFLYSNYSPNTASTNRALAFIKTIEEMKIPVKVIFFLPDKKKSKIEGHFEYVNVMYCWDYFFFDNRVLKYVSYLFYLIFIFCKLRKGDKVYIASQEDILFFMSFKKKIKIFYEKSEVPEVNMNSSRLYCPSLSKHLDLCKKVDGLFVISSQLKGYYRERGINKKKIHIINMIVDPIRFEGVRKNDKQINYVAYCGSISIYKDGVDVLIEAFSLIAQNYPQISLYIIGGYLSKEDKEEIEKLVKFKRLEDKIVFTGPVPSDLMPQFLKDAKILALSRPDNIQAKYGFPTKLGEYLLTGNPVVVTSVGDIPLFLKDGDNVLMAKPNDIDDFAEKLAWALGNPDECRKIGMRGRDVALQHFNAKIETRKMMDVITSA